MIDPAVISDLAFVVAAYAVILGGVTLYAASLVRRLRRAARAVPRPGESAEPDR